jgi:hypothetical protein
MHNIYQMVTKAAMLSEVHSMSKYLHYCFLTMTKEGYNFVYMKEGS